MSQWTAPTLSHVQFNPGAGMRKSALMIFFASSMNTASAEEVTAQALSPHSAEIMTIERSLLLEPRQSPPVCDDHTCGFRLLDESWKRGILPPGFKASGANDFKVENAGSVILERARAGETEGLYEASPPKLTFKFLGMDCELGTFTAGGKQEGGTRCPF